MTSPLADLIGVEEIEAAARSDARIIALLQGKTIRKTVVVPSKLVNFVF